MSYLENTERVFLISKDSELNKASDITYTLPPAHHYISSSEQGLEDDWEHDVAESYNEALLSAKKLIDSDNIKKVYIYEASEKFHDGEVTEYCGYDEDEDGPVHWADKDPDYYSYKTFNSVEITQNKNGITIKELGDSNTKEWISRDLDIQIKKIKDDTQYHLMKDSDGTVAMTHELRGIRRSVSDFVNKNFKSDYQKSINERIFNIEFIGSSKELKKEVDSLIINEKDLKNN